MSDRSLEGGRMHRRILQVPEERGEGMEGKGRRGEIKKKNPSKSLADEKIHRSIGGRSHRESEQLKG